MRTVQSLPVLMYHYINDYKNPIGVSCALFEEHCRTFAENGWRGISLAEAENFLVHGEALPRKSVLFTFDDGYLDNYMHAMPLLHKYGHKGVMFAVSNRLEPGTHPRASVEALLEGTAPSMPILHTPVQKDAFGYSQRRDIFCNYAEVQGMDAAGVLAVASHSQSHTGVFTGQDFAAFTRPGKQVRTFYSTTFGTVWGLPAFPINAGLANRAFLPSAELLDTVTSIVPQDVKEAHAFFADADNVNRLASAVRQLGQLGRFENDMEQQERMHTDIAGGKMALEGILGHAVHSLCWPWGQYNELALDIGRNAGFSVFFTTKEGANLPAHPLAVHRFKAKAQTGGWLLRRSWLYARPLLGQLYARIRM